MDIITGVIVGAIIAYVAYKLGQRDGIASMQAIAPVTVEAPEDFSDEEDLTEEEMSEAKRAYLARKASNVTIRDGE